MISHPDSALRMERFGFTYPGRADAALAGVNLNVTRGEFVLVCGRSGSGKSTLLRAVSGLVPHHFGGAVTGEAGICGRDLRDSRPAALAEVCGSVFQDPEAQVVMGGVMREIAFPLENLGRTVAEVRREVPAVAARLGIENLLDRRTAELSGGELQRVVLAAALAVRPPLLVLDEPSSQLDPEGANELLATLGELNIVHGTTVLLAEHRIERAIEIAGRVIVMDGGRIVQDAAPGEFLRWAAASSSRDWLLTPRARLCSLAGLEPLPVGFDQARETVEQATGDTTTFGDGLPVLPAKPPGGARRAVLRFDDVSFSHEPGAGKAISSISLSVAAGERVALMGANGSGKSTLLRLARRLITPDEGAVHTDGEVGLLLQNPNDYLIHDRVADEAPRASLERFGLAAMVERDPRDLSGGERQRLALAIVMQNRPPVLMLDEPTRGMDRERKTELVLLLTALAEDGTAVIVATHDAEFAAGFAGRAVLIESGRLMLDGPAFELLDGDRRYSTETARLMPGSGALTPEQGASMIVASRRESVFSPAGAFRR